MNATIRLRNPPPILGDLHCNAVFDPRIWTVTLILLGGLWLVSYLWARLPAVWLSEMRFGW
jgi:hypothetical protein